MERNSDILLPTKIQGPPGRPRGVPRLRRYTILPDSSGSVSGPLNRGMGPENLQSEAFKRHPNQTLKPPEPTPSDAKKQQLYSKLPPDDGAPQPIS